MASHTYSFCGTIIRITGNCEITFLLTELTDSQAQHVEPIDDRALLHCDRLKIHANNPEAFEDWDVVFQTPFKATIGNVPQHSMETVFGHIEKYSISEAPSQEGAVHELEAQSASFYSPTVCRTATGLIRAEADVMLSKSALGTTIAFQNQSALSEAGIPDSILLSELDVSIEQRRMIRLESIRSKPPYTLWLDLPSRD